MTVAAGNLSAEQEIRERALAHAVSYSSGLNMVLDKGQELVTGRALLSLAEAYAAFITSGERPANGEAGK